ncbi:hypothetical protein ACFQI7_28865 [Paenibacillus allorhizosphaerae]|uniref:DUF4233 domain-containing protein n=1 Tax=Paenibacillus allorhizosphaerae TaxID=2849866 RepID=A0ABN7TPM9_9BACL|nr:hypothetical protein [Paenibacillus allorhizosphaerae]CAG7650184.1 hypothetical protein PAECIP111802_04659 [Paenibacillus allorhizosphaerae]
MTGSRVLKWITGAFEVFLAIPVVGAAVVLGSAYTALGVMFILHVITLILSAKNKEPFYGSILGIITSVLAWIPLLGWILHLITGILLMVTAAQKSKPSVSNQS